jgi:hypothetical protein
VFKAFPRRQVAQTQALQITDVVTTLCRFESFRSFKLLHQQVCRKCSDSLILSTTPRRFVLSHADLVACVNNLQSAVGSENHVSTPSLRLQHLRGFFIALIITFHVQVPLLIAPPTSAHFSERHDRIDSPPFKAHVSVTRTPHRATWLASHDCPPARPWVQRAACDCNYPVLYRAGSVSGCLVNEALGPSSSFITSTVAVLRP